MKKTIRRSLLWLLSVAMIMASFVTAGTVVSVNAVTVDAASSKLRIWSYLDSVVAADDSIIVKGWSFINGNNYGYVTLTVFIGGDREDPYAEQHFVYADRSRPDVDNVYHCGDRHGFDERIQTNKVGTQPVYVYPIESDGSIGDLIGSATVTLYGPGEEYTVHNATVITSSDNVAYTGSNIKCHVDSVTGSEGYINVTGWAFDNDDPNECLMIHVYVGYPAGHQNAELHIIRADVHRPDVDDVHNCGGYHGFDARIYTNYHGSIPVYIDAINVGAGSTNPCLGGYALTVDDPDFMGHISETEFFVIKNTPAGYRVAVNLSAYPGALFVVVKTWTEALGEEVFIETRATIKDNVAWADISSAPFNSVEGYYHNAIFVYGLNGEPIYYYVDANGGAHVAEIDEELNVEDKVTFFGERLFNGHIYMLLDYPMSWTQAEQWCEDYNGYLATITSEEEWNAVKCLLAQERGPCCWLGAKREGDSFKWVTGEEFSYTDWCPYTPDNATGSENYLGTFNGTVINNYLWNDFSESTGTVSSFMYEQQHTFVVNYVIDHNLVYIDNQLKTRNVPIQLSAIVPEDLHREFLGWSTKENSDKVEYFSGQLYSKNADITLYPVWRVKHDYNDRVIEPTCTNKGYTLHVCKYCGSSYADNYTEKKPHNYDDTVVPLTGDEPGYTLHTCKDCGYSMKDSYVYPELVNNSEISAAAVKLGASVKVTASAAGGDKNYTYTVRYKKSTSSKWTVLRDKDTATEIPIKPVKAVSYDVSVIAYDGSGLSCEKQFALQVFTSLKNESTISAESIGFGDSVTINAKASGGLGDITYAVYYKKSSAEKWSTLQKYSDNTTVTFKPAKAVKYDVKVKIKDSRGIIVKKTLTVNVTKPENTSKLSADTVKLGNTVTVSCSAKGGSGYYQYAVLYKKTSSEKWMTKQNYSSNTTVSIKPAAKATYDICVKVKDSLGNIAKKNFTLTVTK